jgi:hypothetical protein
MHETEHIIIKSADVDKGIIPVVLWLNSFPNITTVTSCQGEEDSEHRSRRPHVGFTCSRQTDLIGVLDRLPNAAHVEVAFYNEVTYYLYFDDTDDLKHFMAYHLPEPFAVPLEEPKPAEPPDNGRRKKAQPAAETE